MTIHLGQHCQPIHACQGPARLSQLNKEITKHYERLGIEAQKRIRQLNLTDLAESNEEYPTLKHQKAAKIRWFAPVAVQLAKEHNEGKAGKHREAVAKELDKLYTLLACPWQDWNEEKQKKMKKGLEAMMSHYSWLARDAMMNGKHLWSLVQKSHLVLHMAGDMHPALTWTYGSESYMGWIATMAASCTHGTPSHKVPSKVCQKFRMMFHLYLKGHMAMDED